MKACFGIFCLAVVLSCSKPENYGRLIRAEVHGGDSIWTSAYVYDGQERLVQIIDEQNLRPEKYVVNLFYNAQGQFYKYTQTGGNNQEFTFDFDAAGRITKQTAHSPQGQHIVAGYGYNNVNRPTSIFGFHPNGTIDTSTQTVFRYNAEGNVDEEKRHYLATLSYNYGDHQNPYLEVNMQLFYIQRAIPAFETHEFALLLSNDLPSSTSRYVHSFHYVPEFDSDGRLTKLSQIRSDGLTYYTVKYYFE